MSRLILGLIIMTLAWGCTTNPADQSADVTTKSQEGIMPPTATQKPHEHTTHGHVRQDPYYWMRERENPEVIAHLEAENAYATKIMDQHKALETKLFEEIKGRIKQDDVSVPVKRGDYYYYDRNEEGKPYEIVCRKKGSLDAPEEIILDGNERGKDSEYYGLAVTRVSPDGKLLAFSEDRVGRRIYTISIKNLETGEIMAQTIENTTGQVIWANDNKTLFFTRRDAQTLRAFQVYRIALGEAEPTLVYQEDDETYFVSVGKSKSNRYIMMRSDQTLSSEYRYIDADKPTSEPVVIIPRERVHEYDVDHHGDTFYVRTNIDAKNFRIMSMPVADSGSRDNWTEVVPHRDDVLINSFDMFKDFMVVAETKNGLVNMQIRPLNGGETHYLDFGEAAYSAGFSSNVDIDSNTLRYSYASLSTPRSWYDYDLNTREKTLLKETEILGGFNRDDYQVERLTATARDGAQVPISLVYRKDKRDAANGNPTLLSGYGSYGISIQPSFRSSVVSLLDRGFVYAIAHIRGSQTLGRAWYEDGKLLKKINTFTDFIDCGKHLLSEKYTQEGQLYARGGSAGGLLMGAVLNMSPETFNGVISDVPFVDVVTTMLDDTIPLTTFEYDEWGNPNDKTYYDYMLSYSPYDQVKAQNYPNILVTTGFHDSQVQYWEPAKWVARLREMKTDDNLLLFKTNMNAGHGGASDRFEVYREIAFDYTFILSLAGIGS